MSEIALAEPRRLAKEGLLSWLLATNHKRVGIYYITTTVFFFFAAGILADIMRLQLARPNQTLISPHEYNQIFTIHGTAMIFLFVAPFGFGIANFLLPLMVGAPDMAFPRLNAYSYWLFLLGGLSVFSGFALEGGSGAAGWTAYAPLSGILSVYGPGQDMWCLGLILTSVSAIMTAINFLVTVFIYRAPGMSMWRIPIFAWEMVATSMLVLMAFPALTAALAMLLFDRRAGAHFFDARLGGDPILYQHLFWWFGHPEVYVLILPFFGIVTEIVAVFSRKPVFGYTGLVLSAFAIAGLSMGVWAHHMFTTGAVNDPFFSAMSLLIAVPTGIKFFNWIATMWRGAITYETPMLFVIGFMLNFLIGGITGIFLASPPIDYDAHGSYFLVAHFHYTIGGGSMFAIFAALYFWGPKIWGVRLDERLGAINFWTMFVGFNITFFPMFFLGVMGMARRIVTYQSQPDWNALNLVASLGTVLITISVGVFVWNVVTARLAARPVGDDPWEGAYTLEWATTSPPPEYNFETLPPIRSRRPAFDLHYPQSAQEPS